jgi:peptidoglycan/xylan/chitin deacetylase (PgdA/CDA1 family)
LRRRLLHGLEAGLYWSGAAALYVKASRARGATVLMYHSVPDAAIRRWIDPRSAVPLEIFEAQMDFLARRRKVVSMSELVGTLEGGDSPEPGTVVISFDDGYRDTLEVAAPVLERHGFPAILYLATGYVTRAENQWASQLHAAFQFRTEHRLCVEGHEPQRFELRGEGAVLEAYESIARRLLTADWKERSRLLGQVTEQLLPREEPPRLTLTWAEIAELTRRHPRFEIGVHTRDHIDLTAHGEETARAEIEACVADVARELNVSVEHFSFPYGRSNDRIRQIVADSSLRSAVVTEPASLIRRDTYRYAMPRTEVTPAMTRFRFQTSGAYPDLPLALLGRA